MIKVAYVEIENFKTFGDKIRIDLDHPAVLVGPNNAGKTSVIQALVLWNRCVRAWYEKKGQSKQKDKRERISVAINRMTILEAPVSDTRFLWNEKRIRRGTTSVGITINVGLVSDGKVRDCRMIYKYQGTEVMYCQPCPVTVIDEELLTSAAKLQFSLLYPMSGIETEEPLIQEGRINVLMGQGQTAQVLRNLCYKVVESDNAHGTSNWKKISDLMKQLFMVELIEPQLNSNRGNLLLEYRQEGVERELEISLAGRGLQQMLLILAYLYSHKNSVLLIDEPDAHLEILRQKQVYEILKDIASENECQVIIATHSEVILDDAVDTNLTLLINGKAVNLAKKNDMKLALRTFGIDHYYKAKILPRILYVEGSTDLEILKTIARKINHPAYDILSGKLNYYYIQNTMPDDSLENRIDRAGGGAQINFRQHFNTLKRFVPEFKGIALFDSDGRKMADEINEDIAVLYWKNYEIENYFISPEVILDFIDDYFNSADPSVKSACIKAMQDIIEKKLLSEVFEGDKNQFKEFQKASKSFRRTLLKNIKMSGFTEDIFKKLADELGQEILLKKSDFYKLFKYAQVEDIPKEVSEKLDLIVEYLKREDAALPAGNILAAE